MVRSVRSALMLLTASVVLGTTAGLLAGPDEYGLTVHEWGTFTSVAGPNGASVDWTPLSGPQDLPCFVDRARPEPVALPASPATRGITADQITNISLKGRDIYGFLTELAAATPAQAAAPRVELLPRAILRAKIRMETPVLYFYAPADMRVGVKVAFRQGAMSEWYPKATVPSRDLAQPLAASTDTIEWPDVRVMPGASAPLPSDGVKSHYYAARHVDASPLQVGAEYERFLFYRGLADFQPPIDATINDTTVVVSAADAVTNAVLFENRGGRVGFRVLHPTRAVMTMARPALTVRGSDAVRVELVAMLTAAGLYPKEAAAMVETWRDSWFEEGTRVFYTIPQSTIDGRLPLTISPAPARIARVFVGRLELITDDMKNDVERALVQNDLDTLNLYGRFLDSIVLQIQDRPAITSNAVRIAATLAALGKAGARTSCPAE